MEGNERRQHCKLGVRRWRTFVARRCLGLDTHQPSSIIVTVFIVIFAATFVCTLAYLGYRQTKVTRQKQANKPHQELEKVAPGRVPLLDIVEMARKAGWDIRSNDASDLTARLNQAAADGTIKFWGRRYEYDFGRNGRHEFSYYRDFSGALYGIQFPTTELISGWAKKLLYFYRETWQAAA
jgi:hypothetical protein